MDCDVERIVIADPTIIRNLCREGIHVEEVLLCHRGRRDGDRPTRENQGKSPLWDLTAPRLTLSTVKTPRKKQGKA